VRGEDLWGRGPFINGLWERLKGNSIHLVAPRRFGKTSVMRALCDRPREGWKAVYFNAEAITEPVAFARRLIDAARQADPSWRTVSARGLEAAAEGLKAMVSAAAVGVSPDQRVWLEVRRDPKHEWEGRSRSLRRTLRKVDTRVLFAVDELAVMLERFRRHGTADGGIDLFLHWFRDLRTDPAAGLENCRFILGNSIGLEGALSRMGAIDTINDLQRLVLDELAPHDAEALLVAVLDGAGVALSRAARRRALDLIGPPVPFFIQVLADALVDAARSGRRLGPEAIQAAYEQRVVGTHGQTYFQHYYDRLRRYEPIDHGLALLLLRHLAETGRAATTTLWSIYARRAGKRRGEEDFRRLLAELQTDFYIRVDPKIGEYVFWSNILRDWWRRHHCM